GLPLAIDDRENSILVGYDNVFRPLTTSWLVTAGLRQRDSVDYAFTLAYDGQGNRSRELLQSADGSLTEIIYSYQGGLLRSRTAVTQAALSGAALIGIVLLALRRRRSILLSAVAIGVMAAGLLLVRAPPTPAYTYRYNDAGHLASITYLTAADEPVVTSFAYDGFGRLLSITVGEETTSFEYDALGRLIATESPGGRVEYRYNGRQLVGLNDGAERAVIGLLADQYLLLTGPEGSRWSLYDAPAGNRQSFLDEHTSSPSAANRFENLGRALGEDIQPGTPLALPMFNGMLYNAQHNLYIGLDGRAYDPAVGRYLQRSLTGPDAAGNLYNFALLPSRPPVQVERQAAYAEPLALLDAHAHMLDAPTASSVLADHLPEVYPGWHDAGLDALDAFHAAQRAAFTDLVANPHALIYDYNRAGVLTDAQGNFTLSDTTNPARPATPPALPLLHPPQPAMLPDVSLRWLPAAVSTDIRPPRWFDPSRWRG